MQFSSSSGARDYFDQGFGEIASKSRRAESLKAVVPLIVVLVKIVKPEGVAGRK